MQEPKTREILHCLFAFSFLYPNRSGVVELSGARDSGGGP